MCCKQIRNACGWEKYLKSEEKNDDFTGEWKMEILSLRLDIYA